MTLIIEMASGLRCDDDRHSRCTANPVLTAPRGDTSDSGLGLTLVPVMEVTSTTVAMPASLRTTDITTFLDAMD